MKCTKKQAKANKLNARKSTGPRTAEGKAKSRLNGLVHGMRAETTVLPTEDQTEWEKEREIWREDWNANTESLRTLADEGARNAWLIRRSFRVETKHLKELAAQKLAEFRSSRDQTLQAATEQLANDPISALRVLLDFRVGVQWLINCGEVEFATPEERLACKVLNHLGITRLDLEEQLTHFPTEAEEEHDVLESAYIDDSSRGRSLMRYEAKAHRILHKTIDQLMSLAREKTAIVAEEPTLPLVVETDVQSPTFAPTANDNTDQCHSSASLAPLAPTEPISDASSFAASYSSENSTGISLESRLETPVDKTPASDARSLTSRNNGADQIRLSRSPTPAAPTEPISDANSLTAKNSDEKSMVIYLAWSHDADKAGLQRPRASPEALNLSAHDAIWPEISRSA